MIRELRQEMIRKKLWNVMLKQLRNHKTDAFIEKGLDSEGWCGLLKAFDNWRNLLSQFSVTTEAYVFD